MDERIDRKLLGPEGLRLSDADYLQAVAALGHYQTAGAQDRSPPDDLVGWSGHNFSLETKLPLSKKNLAEWEAVLLNSRGRIRIDQYPDHLDVAAIARILSTSEVGASSVFVGLDRPSFDPRWQWPVRVGALTESFQTLKLAALAKPWPASKLAVPTELSRTASRCELLVSSRNVRGTLEDVLSCGFPLRAGHILIFAAADLRWPEVQHHISTLLSETQAGGISICPVPRRESESAINELFNNLSHNQPLDVALFRAFGINAIHALDSRLILAASLPTAARQVGRRLQQIEVGSAFRLDQKTMARIQEPAELAGKPKELGERLESVAPDLPFRGEGEGASAITEIALAERAFREAPQEVESRFLQGDLFAAAEGSKISRVTTGMAIGERYLLNVFVGPEERESIVADRPFPDEDLDWKNKESHTLRIILSEPDQWPDPMTGTLELPWRGKGSTCQFAFSPTKAGRFSGRVTVIHRGRVLQTALLKTTVAKDRESVPRKGKVELVVEIALRHGFQNLENRQRFDAGIVLNHTSSAKPAMLGATSDAAYIASLDDARPQLSKISSLLNDVALRAKELSKGLRKKPNAEILCRLAKEGAVVYRKLVLDYIALSSAADAINRSQYLQIVSAQPDAVVPLEYVYQYPVPRSAAPVCPNAVQALKKGVCPEDCRPTASPAPHVCPMGFWGLSKVIERHVHDPALRTGATVAASADSNGTALKLSGHSLIAMSNNVPKTARAKLTKRVIKLRKGNASEAADWRNWQKIVSMKKPALFIALPHAGGSGAEITLEIGGKALESVYIDRTYVRGDSAAKPLVLLLGCDTACVGDLEAYAKHVAVFRQGDAAVVLGTLATVYGEDAAAMAERIVEALSRIKKGRNLRFGEILLETKRAAVAESLLIALCLVAFGDADWKLEV